MRTMTATERYEKSEKGLARKRAWVARRSPEQIEKQRETNRLASRRWRQKQRELRLQKQESSP